MDATNPETLVERFEARRPQLKAIAYRMLGSLAEADEAVQETWIRLSKSGDEGVERLDGWLTTIVARVCLNLLRARRVRKEIASGVHLPDPVIEVEEQSNAEKEVMLADSVGLALLLVLDTLEPAERLAFVLHDMFDLPFEDIGALVERTPEAARQLASRARRRIRGAAPPEADADVARQRAAVQAFFSAARGGDFDALVAILHPDVVMRADGGAANPKATAILHGAEAVARQAVRFANPKATLRPARVNGAAGVVVFVGDKPAAVMGFTVTNGVIVEINALNDPERIARLDLESFGG